MMLYLPSMNFCFAAITLTVVNSLPAQKPVDPAKDLGVKEARNYSYNSKHDHQLISYFLNSYSNFDSKARPNQIKQSPNVSDNLTKYDVRDNLTKSNVGDNFTELDDIDNPIEFNVSYKLIKSDVGDNLTKPDFGDNLTKLKVGDNLTKPDVRDILTKLDVGDNLTEANVGEKLMPIVSGNLTEPDVGENLTKSIVSDNLSNTDVNDIVFKPSQTKPNNDNFSQMAATTDKEELLDIGENYMRNSQVITEKTPTVLEILMMSKVNKSRDYEREVYAALQEKWKNAKVISSNTVEVGDSELDENAEEIREMEMNEINNINKGEEKQVEVTEDLPEGEAVLSGEDATEQEAENRSDSQSQGLISNIMNYLFSFY